MFLSACRLGRDPQAANANEVLRDWRTPELPELFRAQGGLAALIVPYQLPLGSGWQAGVMELLTWSNRVAKAKAQSAQGNSIEGGTHTCIACRVMRIRVWLHRVV